MGSRSLSLHLHPDRIFAFELLIDRQLFRTFRALKVYQQGFLIRFHDKDQSLAPRLITHPRYPSLLENEDLHFGER